MSMTDVKTLRYPGALPHDGFVRETTREMIRMIHLSGIPWCLYSTNELGYEYARLIDARDEAEIRNMKSAVRHLFRYRFPYSRSKRGQIQYKQAWAWHVPLEEQKGGGTNE